MLLLPQDQLKGWMGLVSIWSSYSLCLMLCVNVAGHEDMEPQVGPRGRGKASPTGEPKVIYRFCTYEREYFEEH